MCKDVNLKSEKVSLNNAELDKLDLNKVSGGASIGSNNKCAYWECKFCARKATDPFYVGGMHTEGCYYIGIVGCKCCKHYVKGKTCKYDLSIK